MAVFFGAERDLGNLLKTHLFLLCPNNSGSSFLIGAINRSNNVWSLSREGQHVPGFKGPHSRGTDSSLTWGAKPELIELFRDPKNYDWARTRQAWYFQATAHHSSANIFAAKSPPFLLFPEMLREHFANTRFIIMLRNPYAMAEGILRRRPRSRAMTAEVAEHVAKCFECQTQNLETLTGQSIFFTYEDMCDRPDATKAALAEFLPGLNDIEFHEAVPVKGMYDQSVTNFNDAQITRLDAEQVEALNELFRPHANLFAKFGYDKRPDRT